MSLHARCDSSTTTTGGTHSRDEDNILNPLVVEFLAIIPALVIKPLADQLDRGLSTVLLLLGHVQIINKDTVFLARRRAEDTFTPLLKFLIKSILHLVSASLSRESQRNGLVVFTHLSVQHVLNVDSFTCTSGTGGKNVLSIGNKKFLNELHSDGVKGGHNDFGVDSLGVNLKWLDNFSPDLPFFGFLVEAVIVTTAIVREFELVVFAHDFTQLLVEFDATISSCGATGGPDSGEDKECFDHAFKIFNLFDSQFLELSVKVRVNETVQHTHERSSNVIVNGSYRLVKVLTHEINGRFQILLEQNIEHGKTSFTQLERGRNNFHPRFDKRLNSDSSRLHVHHTAAGNSSRRSHSQIFDLEHHCHVFTQGNNLTRVEAQLLVIIEHSVHRLNPQSVDRAIEHDPVLVRVGILTSVSDKASSNTVHPLIGSQVHGTIKLVHSDGFGIQNVAVSNLKVLLIFKLSLSMLQHFVIKSLTATRWADQHETVTHLARIVQLNDLVEEGGLRLHVVILATLHKLNHQLTVVNVRLFNSGEQILNNVLKQGQVIFEELWHVDIAQRPQKKLVLIHVRVGTLK